MSPNKVPEDLLPQPVQGSSRAASTAGSRIGATMPRPGGATVTVVPTPTEVSAPVIDIRGPQPTVTPATKPKAATQPKKRQQSKPPAPPAQPKQLNVTIPESLLKTVDADDRSRTDVLRDAYEHHAQSVADAHPIPTTTPAVAGMRQRSTRRSAPAGDSFTEVRFRLHPDEVDALDHWRAKTPLTRSAFVTQLLRSELDHVS